MNTRSFTSLFNDDNQLEKQDLTETERTIGKEKLVNTWTPVDLLDTTILPVTEDDVSRIKELFNPYEGEIVDGENVDLKPGVPAKRSISPWLPLDISNTPLEQTKEFIEHQESIISKDVIDSEDGIGVLSEESDESFSFEMEDEDILEDIVQDDPEVKKKILEQAEIEAERLTHQRLAEAQKQADIIIQKAHSEATSVREQSRQEGLTDGKAEMKPVLQTAQSMLEQIYTWRTEMLGQSESTVLTMIKDMAKILFSEGIELDDNILQQTFSRVLMNARTLGNLRVYVNPDDAKLLDPAWREYQLLVSGQKIQIFPTPAIKRGGCYIEGQRGSIDAQIETQLKSLFESITSLESQETSTPTSPPKEFETQK